MGQALTLPILNKQALRQCLHNGQQQSTGHLQRWSWPHGQAQEQAHEQTNEQSHEQQAQAAVLMPFFGNGAETGASLILTRRARHLRRHAGQMSFPGGVAEPEDENLLATAIRETAEETGIGTDFITPLGKLGEMTTISGYRLHVYAAWLQPGFAITPDPAEVETVYQTDACLALHPDTFIWQEREIPAGTLRMPELILEDQRVWGITAVIMWQMSCLLHGLDAAGLDRS